MDEKSSLNIRTSEEKSFLEKLLWSKFKDWNADELCLLDAYLTRINPQNPEGGKVRFTLKEYANLLGVSDLCYEQIESCTRKFLGNVVTINYEEKFEMYSLFSSARCYKDENQYVIELDCDDQIREIFFSIARNSSIKGRLQSMARMSKQYSIKLYSLLVDMMQMPKDEPKVICIEELRTQLGIYPGTYEEFKIFKRDVLEPVVKEINQVSNLNIAYVCIKSGRKCTAIKFDADFKDEQEFQKVIGIPAQKKVPVNRMDYSTFFPNLSIADANKIGRKVKKRVQLLYPSLPQNLEDTVVGHILSNLQKSLCESNDLTRIDIRQILKKLGEDNFFKEITPLRYWQYMENQSL